MSKDIRSFFQIQSSKKKENAEAKPKRKADTFNSSDEDKASSKKTNNHETKKKRRIVDSDDEDDIKKVKVKPKPDEKKKKVEVDVLSMFGAEPVKRKERPKLPKKSPNKSANVSTIDDDEIDHDLSLVADDIERQEVSKKKDESRKSVKKESPIKSVKIELKKSPTKSSESDKKRLHSNSPNPSGSKKPKPSEASSSSSKKHQEKKIVETTVEDDESRQERKEAARALYHKFKNRSTVINHGCKKIPKGKPDCLNGLQFVISGILESMEREEAADLIKTHGGKIVSALSRKVTHLLVGEEAGPLKLVKAEEMGIKQISEDDLLKLIRKKSGLPLDEPESLEVEDVEEIKKDSPGKENRVKNEVNPEIQSPVSEKKSKKVEKIDTPTPIAPTRSEPKNLDDLSFVDKYKPTSVKQIIGQQGPSGNAQKLTTWLSNWHSNNDGKKKHVKPNPWAKNNDGSAFKAALLSGGPGVGKTTTAHLVARELMYDIVEFNASDTRSKKLLKEEVSALLSNTSISGYATGNSTKPTKRHVLIMDEVDGMAGNEDRGGVAELIALIKDSHIPVICMCNDRNHSKIRSLANYCFDLRFNKPSLQMIKGAMMSICFKEGIKLEPGAMDEIIEGTGNDIRQTLNHLAMYGASKDSKLGKDDAKKNAQSAEKDVRISQFEVTRKVFSTEEHKKMTFNDRFDLFFHDYSMAPLFVQENYLHSKPNCSKQELLERVANAADALSMGDLIEKRIRSNMAWSLLPTQAAFSSVLPGEFMGGTFGGPINFPGWLGKTSKANKRKRLAQEVHDHTRISTSGSRLSVRLDYAPFLVQAIVKPLKDKGLEGVPEALNVMKEYRFLREDIDGLLELTTWPKMKNMWESVDSKVKAALTRAYNKEVQPYSYSAQAGVKKKASRSADNDDLEGYENEDGVATVESDVEDDSLENNALIKVKKPASSKDSKAGTSKASSSKAGTSKSKSKK